MSKEADRCSSVHYLSRWACCHDAGHRGPHVGLIEGTPWAYVWRHKVGEPMCNQTAVRKNDKDWPFKTEEA